MNYVGGSSVLYNATRNTDLVVKVVGGPDDVVCTGTLSMLREGRLPDEPVEIGHEELRTGHVLRIGPDVRILSVQVRVTFNTPEEESVRVIAELAPSGRPEEPYCCEVRGQNGSSRTCSIGVLV